MHASHTGAHTHVPMQAHRHTHTEDEQILLTGQCVGNVFKGNNVTLQAKKLPLHTEITQTKNKLQKYIQHNATPAGSGCSALTGFSSMCLSPKGQRSRRGKEGGGGCAISSRRVMIFESSTFLFSVLSINDQR